MARLLLALTVATAALGVVLPLPADDDGSGGKSETDPSTWNNLMEGCGSTKNCLGIPPGCESSGSCTAIVTVEVIDTKFVFRMRATDAKYVAVGLGDTALMSGTSVIECVKENLGKENLGIKTYLSYTPTTEKNCIRVNDKGSLTLDSAKVMDGGLYCQVTRVNKTRPNPDGKDFFLDETPYFLQLAKGDSIKADGTGINIHDDKSATDRALYLSEYEAVGTQSNWPMRMHGALMVIAWMFAATSGSLAARYFKAAWGKTTMCGKAMWFAWHRLFMLLTLALHLVAVVAALIFLQGWSSSSGLHGILGGVTTALALLQGLGGLLRPGPDGKYRPLFNWAHRGQGFATHIIAMVTIFLAVGLGSTGLPDYTYYILGVYVVFYVALHAVHSLTEVKSYYFIFVVFGSAVFALAVLILVVVAPGKS